MTHPHLPLARGGDHEQLLVSLRVLGKTFSNSERQAITQLDFQDGSWQRPANPQPAEPEDRAIVQWRLTYTYRYDSSYQPYVVCGPDALSTAIETLLQRRTQYSASELAVWIEAQNTVFRSCDDPTATPPEHLDSNASELARQDRAYQRASTLSNCARTTERAYPANTVSSSGEAGMDPARADEVIAAYQQVANDATSPWRDLAIYRIVYTNFLLHRATPAEIADALYIVRQPKALRGLQQLESRLRYMEGAAQAYDELLQRVATTDLGDELPHALDDLRWLYRFELTGEERSARAILGTTQSCRTSCTATACSRAASPGEPLWRLHDAFAQAQTELSDGRLAAVRRILREVAPALAQSTVSTRSRFRTLEMYLARTPMEALRASFVRSDNGEWWPTWESLALLESLPLSTWRTVLASSDEPFVHMIGSLRQNLRRYGALRAILAGDRDSYAHFSQQPSASLQSPMARFQTEALYEMVHPPCPGNLCSGEAQVYDLAIGRLGYLEWDLQPALTFDIASPTQLQHLRPSEDTMPALARLLIQLANDLPDDERIPELLHLYTTQMSRYRRNHGSAVTRSSRATFRLLHQRYPTSVWTEQTRHYY